MECFKYPPIEHEFKTIGKVSLPNPLVSNVENLFGGFQDLRNRNCDEIDTIYTIFEVDNSSFRVEIQPKNSIVNSGSFYSNYFNLGEKFSRFFINNKSKQKLNFTGSAKLSFSTDNLEKVLKRLLKNEEKREDISDWLSLFIPEFDRIEVQKSEFSNSEELLIYEKHYDKPFGKELISDGTYNIIALLTAVFQSDEPQFLCIEEPENGLHPYAIRKLVDFFRDACKEKGHYIWLNTHSDTLVAQLTPEEIIVVDKENGETKITQLKGTNLYGLDMSEYWLSGIKGGTPW